MEILTSVLTEPGELGQFLAGVAELAGDPSAAVCQVFVPWEAADDDIGDLVPDFDPKDRMLLLAIVGTGLEPPVISLPISEDLSPQIDERGNVAFGLRKVCRGVWALALSLNLPGLMHSFVVFHGVPEPAPWERLIVLVTACASEPSRTRSACPGTSTSGLTRTSCGRTQFAYDRAIAWARSPAGTPYGAREPTR
jgi:hypothetical protein